MGSKPTTSTNFKIDYMYLFIFEGGTIIRKTDYTSKDLNIVKNGFAELIDISGNIPLFYDRDGKWKEIEIKL